MPQLGYIDLFSGIGGLALALKGIAAPVVYCDIEESSQAVLRKNMRAGKLPQAPIIPDVRDVSGKTKYGSRVRMVAGTPPCVGFSPLGRKQGYEDPQSGLMMEMLRIVDEAQPDLVFMENVPNIVNAGMTIVLDRLGAERGYDIYWTTFAASSVGAPHYRRRWFCLCVKPGTHMTWQLPQRKAYDWRREPVPRQVLQRGAYHAERLGMLGNAVVPEAARAAFMLLASGWRQTSGNTLRLAAPPPELMKRRTRGGLPSSGAWIRGEFYQLPTIQPTDPQLSLRLQFDAVPASLPPRVTTEVVRSKKMRAWSTPRTSQVEACRILTERSVRDLPTQARFEVGTPEHLRPGHLEPKFVEWLMGFPLGWTEVRPVKSKQRSADNNKA